MYNRGSIWFPNKFKRYSLTIQGSTNDTLIYIDNMNRDKRKNKNVLSGLTANFYLGCGNKMKNLCKARFNSIRVYNRMLTEEEINHNYQYDQSIERGDN